MIAIVLGTRPEIIKMSPIIRLLRDNQEDYLLIHSGQHYSYDMDKIFFEELELPVPEFYLDVGSGNHGEQTARILTGIERVLMQERPDTVLVQGDTNTVFAGALAAVKLHIDVGHVEAGLRSHDRRMPEEINRVLTDHISEYLFAPTQESRNNAVLEGIPSDKIYVTGNTIVDAVQQNLRIAEDRRGFLDEYGLKTRGYFLVTAHRQENVDDKFRLRNLLKALEILRDEYSMPVVFPIHPRTRRRIEEYQLNVSPDITLIPPTGFLEFLVLEGNARLVLTDSGGVQEETCILRVPCVTLRENTERPETIEVGSNILTGITPGEIVQAVGTMLEEETNWTNPFGDGRAAQKIVDSIHTR
ncbi:MULTISPECIES: non-hydrolyzing UDP-N-acetylglucosamine 2-epimerase [Methanoculleus]|uniref:UDP-N-acetylglucosamine 2-epimerase n=2 Tax=Methanoculleus TaxID=45989 RepID=A3CVX4_METMJ|nr:MULTISPECIES: UDP-N-acetylglucosamine 2-epimerase (non-hydrolyzing) [Methanoculleus]ABN57524.1 UDP-N-acetylglucosamine 2-epimerase [Methanoculleus marisnigri JR1]MCC7554872.1 UDP-N-acetylglucosamine 2-epimerase (non-hydrolyzing) [Methanoculleus marisnigri]UYU18927.1 UDP-N-acetylglucosamine 2-epimerase (non-hydrolyzing) [Methanoculleus submarinus]